MKIELTDEQLDFLIRALVCNYGHQETDFKQGNIGDRGMGDLILGKLLALTGAYDDWQKACKERYLKTSINKNGPISLGGGWYSLLGINACHKRLAFAFSELGGLQQNGGMGTEFDEKMDQECRKNIKEVLRELIRAFGMRVEDLRE